MSNFIEKTVLSIQNTFEDMFLSDTIADKKGVMQSLDPRIKLISTIAFIIIVNFGKSISFMAVMLVYSLLLAILSRIPLKMYLFRVSTISIIFSGIVLIPSLFNIVKPGEPLLFLTRNIYITRDGIYSAIIFIIRSFISLSFVYILILSTKWVEILKALRVFRFPKIFTATLDIALRYITLLLEISSNMFLARKSRNIGKSNSSNGRKFVASSVGNLLIRSESLSNDVYNAMTSRGYIGEYITINKFKIGPFDYLWIIFNIAFVILVSLFKGGIHWI